MAILTDENYVDKAEKAILQLRKKNDEFFLTTSQIRNILSLTSSISDKSNVRNFEELNSDLSYLRVRLVYQSRRNEIRFRGEKIYPVEDLLLQSDLLEALKEVKDKVSLQRFCRYMEALVAYFKFYGGKD
ncbi:hypothetical protein D8890_05780 [Streptococcus sanguinis]|jgi:CRISPR-associated protein, csm2 family|uniref:CRISPR system Cms protein Csm2 n=1 Tax=Streptococcus sanguinis TaxID=1305 RepID=A0A2X3YP37_STRSA|nr:MULTISPECIES: type III-A CRISPR-associated protein Csm2 [Streptococcus]RKV69854.1 MAG: type III-A CRISPR-associated protein Csm2 [Streptococcus sp.]MBZ2056845.1 type III-A CRISPR-associated protein Csm2 [Streptococcus sanguinis]MDN5011160.1 type III-A CRISPR-associated protein Csm2 [Streptococcus sp. SN3]RSI05163.1 hypothetical protein D8890_05780 [Streptococcus sanguinis]SQF71236.1 CRISPR-system related protein [Streptococcus sanguinis]